MSKVLYTAFKKGCKLDGWNEYFSYTKWLEAFDECGMDIDFYACRQRETDEVMPWDIVDVGVRREHLWHEKEQCYRSRLSPDCRKQCSACGAAKLLKGGRCDG